ncbi:MAG: hypothetical protein HC799_08155 [Limnothrix sp. RL_2_0]|nr:hypothetical protein [Limnothrix sp. RL_2_0]
MFSTKNNQLSDKKLSLLFSDIEIAGFVRGENRKKIMNMCKSSLKLATSTAIFSVLASFNAQIARADHLNFTLYNETSQSIYYLYVSPARSDTWGSDVLGDDILRSGAYTRITFPNQTSNSPCIYDVKVVFRNGTKSTGRHNLCEFDSVTIR